MARKRSQVSAAMKQRMQNDRNQLMKLNAIAKKYGVSISTVRNHTASPKGGPKRITPVSSRSRRVVRRQTANLMYELLDLQKRWGRDVKALTGLEEIVGSWLEMIRMTKKAWSK